MNRIQRALEALLERIDTPAPIVLADVMQENIDRMQAFAAQHNLDVRPHVKTHKCVEIGRRQVKAGAVGITAGNVGEAEVFAAAGFDDIFLAYPIWASGNERAADPQTGRNHPAAGRRRQRRGDQCPRRRDGGRTRSCCRSSLRSTAVPAVPGLLPRPRANSPSPRATAAWSRPASSPIRATAAPVRTPASVPRMTRMPRSSPRSAASAQRGSPPEVVSAGSTPTVEFATNSVITEIRPGEYVFNDLNNTRLGACTEDQIALFVAGTVVSDWVPDQVILDIGTKALGREGNPEIGYGAIAGTTAVLSRLNEYHGFLPLPAGDFRPSIGTVLPVVPNHVCPVVVNFEEYIVTDSTGTTLERWPVDARGFLN